MIIRLTLLALIVTSVAIMNMWLTNEIQIDLVPTKAQTHDNIPDFYIKHFTVQGTNPDGSPRFALAAELMQHYPFDDHADLVEPRVKFYSRDGGAPWLVNAQSGRVESGGHSLTLFGDTHIRRKGSEHNLPADLITSNITYSPATNKVTTNYQVDYTSNLNRISGKGMDANLLDHVIQLHDECKHNSTCTDKSRVRIKGHYEPNER